MPSIKPMSAHALVQPIDCVIATMSVRLANQSTITINTPDGHHDTFAVQGGLQATLRWAQIERVIMVLERRGECNDDIIKLTIDLLCSTTDHIFRDLGSLVQLIEEMYAAGV